MSRTSVTPINANRFGLWEMILGFFLVIPMYQWGIVAIMNLMLGGLYGLFPWMFTDMGTLNSWWNLFYYIILSLLMAGVFCRFIAGEWRLFQKNFAECMRDWWMWFAFCLGANMSGGIIVSLLVTHEENPNQQAIDTAMQAAVVPMLIVTILLGPICEELLFRGLIFRSIRRGNRLLAHLVSAGLFAIVHLLDGILAGGWNLLPMVLPYFLMGLALSIVYEQKHTLIVPITIHMGVNLIATIL